MWVFGKSPKLANSRQSPPRSAKTRQLWFFPKSAGSGPKVATGGGGGIDWVTILSPHPSPHRKLFLFCLVLHSYMRCGPFYWCKLFLLTQFCILMLCSNPGMVTNCCTAQESASVAHTHITFCTDWAYADEQYALPEPAQCAYTKGVRFNLLTTHNIVLYLKENNG